MLPFIQRLKPGALDRGDVHENIARTIVWFDEAITTLGIEELDDTCHCHRELPGVPHRPPSRHDGAASKFRTMESLGPYRSLWHSAGTPSGRPRSHLMKNSAIRHCGKVVTLLSGCNPVEPVAGAPGPKGAPRALQGSRKTG